MRQASPSPTHRKDMELVVPVQPLGGTAIKTSVVMTTVIVLGFWFVCLFSIAVNLLHYHY
jgi:hypothetical protein